MTLRYGKSADADPTEHSGLVTTARYSNMNSRASTRQVFDRCSFILSNDNIGAEHSASILELYGRSFGARNARRFDQRWCWQYEDNPWRSQREPMIQLRIQDGRVMAAGSRTVQLCIGSQVPAEECWLEYSYRRPHRSLKYL